MRSSPFGSAGSAIHDDRALGGPSGASGSDETSNDGTLGTLAHLGRQWHRRCHKAKTWASSSDTCVEGPDKDLERQALYHTACDQDIPNASFTTVRMRRHTRRSTGSPGWEFNRDDVERATHTHLLAPTAVGRLIQLFRRPSLQRTYSTSSSDTENASQIQTLRRLPGIRPTQHLLPHDRWIPGTYNTFQDSHHISTLSADIRHNIQNHYPSRRTRTWTYGLDDPRRHSMLASSTKSAEVDEGTQAQSTSVSLTNMEIESLERLSFEEPSLYLPRTPRGTQGSLDSTVAAESMSIIGVPYYGPRRVLGVSAPREASWDPQGYEEMGDLDGYGGLGEADSFGSVPSSRMGSIS
ncbi:MAG: hypothetical protein Q9186_007618 [Xanthomendoza sp. 1 TL-2023]